jgi:hypothetical protein
MNIYRIIKDILMIEKTWRRRLIISLVFGIKGTKELTGKPMQEE